ncbi:MAG TPA: hypothetical protein VM184_01670 [Gaiellaceae bacterium]|nr:hypothetical protein [Gaiellaceae bacterium]
MSRRALGTVLVGVLALAAAGCGGNGNGGDGAEAGGACEDATVELLSTVSERDRLFVDLQLDNAATACAGELAPGNEADCTAARVDLASAAEQEMPPADLEPRVDAAVAACVGQAITSTLPSP